MKIKLLLTAITLAAMARGSAILTLTPAAGLLSGAAGSTVGWGFSLSNPVDFAVITSSSFCLGSSGVTSACLAPAFGSFTDYIASNFVVVGPTPESPIVTQSFSRIANTGLGSFSINSGASSGSMDSGQIVVTYDLYSVDPFDVSFDPGADLVSTGNFLTSAASVSVASTNIMPEPSSWPILAALASICFLRLRLKS